MYVFSGAISIKVTLETPVCKNDVIVSHYHAHHLLIKLENSSRCHTSLQNEWFHCNVEGTWTTRGCTCDAHALSLVAVGLGPLGVLVR